MARQPLMGSSAAGQTEEKTRRDEAWDLRRNRPNNRQIFAPRLSSGTAALGSLYWEPMSTSPVVKSPGPNPANSISLHRTSRSASSVGSERECRSAKKTKSVLVPGTSTLCQALLQVVHDRMATQDAGDSAETRSRCQTYRATLTTPPNSLVLAQMGYLDA